MAKHNSAGNLAGRQTAGGKFWKRDYSVGARRGSVARHPGRTGRARIKTRASEDCFRAQRAMAAFVGGRRRYQTMVSARWSIACHSGSAGLGRESNDNYTGLQDPGYWGLLWRG